jgi:hypothetical protein
MDTNDQDEYENILLLDNIVEANLMESLLQEAEISFYIRPWQDASFDGIWTEQKGWGWVVGRKEDEKAIVEIYRDRVKTAESEE